MVFFKTFEFEFEARRLMWYAPTGGSDFAEVSKTCEAIKEGNYESWYQEWRGLAYHLLRRANHYQDLISTGQSYLRASRYFQAAEFFLPPTDRRKLKMYENSVDSFYKGLDLLGISYKINRVAYEGVELRTVLFETSKECQGTIFVCGGFDALLEELYFTTAKAALARGYHVVLFEGPGQSDLIRRFHLPFTPNWSRVCQAVTTYYQVQLPTPFIGIGLSLGGLLIARAQAQSPTLFDKVVLHNYFPNMLDSFKGNIPKLLHHYVDNQFPRLLEKMVSFYISKQPFLNWQIEHAKWTFGAVSLNDLLAVCREFEELDLQSPTLMCLAKEDNYYDYRLGLAYFERIQTQDKQLVLFDTVEFSSALHCQNGAAYDTNDQIFEWIKRRTKLEDKMK